MAPEPEKVAQSSHLVMAEARRESHALRVLGFRVLGHRLRVLLLNVPVQFRVLVQVLGLAYCKLDVFLARKA